MAGALLTRRTFIAGSIGFGIISVPLFTILFSGLTQLSSKKDLELYMRKAEEYVNDDTIGYSQSTRQHNPNMDCSSFVYYCLVDSGYLDKAELDAACAETGGFAPFTTWTLTEPLINLGFTKIESGINFDTQEGLERGDILVRPSYAGGSGHVAIYAGEGMLYEASGDLDGQDGDSSGQEVHYGSYWGSSSYWNYVLRPTGGTGFGGDISIPAEYGGGGYTVTIYTEKGLYMNNCDISWAQGTSQYVVHQRWNKAGSVFTDGIATLNGRYLIACTTTYGDVGDLIDFYLDDGTKIPCVMADSKNQSDAGCNKWGHNNGKNVLEFEVSLDYYRTYGNPGGATWKSEWRGRRVSSATNLGTSVI